MGILEQKAEREGELAKVLNQLADKNEKIINDAQKEAYYNLFQRIYAEIEGETSEDKNYRHSYSFILSVLIEFDKDETKDISNLVNNVRVMYEYSVDKTDKVKQSIEKLYDHINLDFARLDYIKTSNLKDINRVKKIVAQVEHQETEIINLKDEYQKNKKEFFDKIEEHQNENKENNVTLLYTMIGTILSFSILAGSFEAIMSLPLVSQRVMVMLSSIAIVFITLYYVKMLNFDNGNEKLKKHLKIVIGCVILLILGATIGIFFEYNWYANTIDAYEEKNAELLKRIEILEEKTNNQISVNSYGFPVTAVQQ